MFYSFSTYYMLSWKSAAVCQKSVENLQCLSENCNFLPCLFSTHNTAAISNRLLLCNIINHCSQYIHYKYMYKH